MYGNRKPKHVRNFWLDARVDGRDAHIGTGPSARDGGFDLTIYMRSAGDVVNVLEIIGAARPDGTLSLLVRDPVTNEDVKRIGTDR